jgi:hypothetical protein
MFGSRPVLIALLLAHVCSGFAPVRSTPRRAAWTKSTQSDVLASQFDLDAPTLLRRLPAGDAAPPSFDGAALRALVEARWGASHEVVLRRTRVAPVSATSVYVCVLCDVARVDDAAAAAAYEARLGPLAELLAHWGRAPEFLAARVAASEHTPHETATSLMNVALPLELTFDELVSAGVLAAGEGDYEDYVRPERRKAAKKQRQL